MTSTWCHQEPIMGSWCHCLLECGRSLFSGFWEFFPLDQSFRFLPGDVDCPKKRLTRLQRVRRGGGGTGGLNFPPPAPCTPGSRLCVLFLLRNFVPMLRNFLPFLPAPAPLGYPASLPPNIPLITPGLPPLVPPPTC